MFCKVLIGIVSFVFASMSSIAISTTAAQTCMGGISLGSQSQVDHYKAWYDCAVIEGQLWINGADITNLDSLVGIVEVGALSINSTNIVDLKGLSSLKKINGTAEISFNPSLTSMNGLEELESVNGLFITYNNVLATLEGLNAYYGSMEIDVSQFNNGLFTIVTDKFGEIGRFVKM